MAQKTTKRKKSVSKGDGKKEAKRYWQATGRRKTAVARARITPGKTGVFVINQKPVEDYFQDAEYRLIAKEALERGAGGKPFEVSVLVRGGGMRAQAEAVRHAISRAVVAWDDSLREQMKVLRFLTRDPRMRERKKFGLKRARRARQWRKR